MLKMFFSISIALSLVASIENAARVPATQLSPVQIIDYCELIAHSAEYDGKTLTVRSAYAAGMEGGIFFDDKCSGDSTTAQATFSKTIDWHRLRLYKNLQALVKKNKLGEAEVTMTAEFTDGKARVFGHQMCCRYRLTVKQLLAVEKIESNSATK